MFLLPFMALIFFVLLPLSYISYLLETPDEEKKQMERESFLKKRILDSKNIAKASKWFEKYYEKKLLKRRWWTLNSLMDIPPLARDWASGFTPTLDEYSQDLANLKYLKHIKNIVDRTDEINQIERVLTKNGESNVIIVGEEGVGKHTIVDAFARKIFLGKTNSHLMYKRILKLNMEKIFGSGKSNNQSIDFFETLLNEAHDAGNIVLFIDNFEKYSDLDFVFQEYTSDEKLQVIGITQPIHYENIVFANDRLRKLFEKIEVREVDKNTAFDILLDACFDFEKYHEVIICYETLIKIISKSEFYLTYIPFPEKAVDLLDEICVYAKKSGENRVLPEMVDAVLTEKTHIETRLTDTLRNKLVNIENYLNNEIIDQNQAISEIASSLKVSMLFEGSRKKPLSSMLFLGPTGVGKTQTAKVISDYFFGKGRINRFDMSQYQSKYDIQKLIGSFNHQAGLLSLAVRENPYSVLLLDEIEKADQNLMNIFLTILDEGYFFDGYSRRVDCKNLVVIGTSNAGSQTIFKNPNIDIKNFLVETGIFLPEFLNRFDVVSVFKPLSGKSVTEISKKIIEKIILEFFQSYKIKVTVKEKTLTDIVNSNYNFKFGARDIERALKNTIESKIAEGILDRKIKPYQILEL